MHRSMCAHDGVRMRYQKRKMVLNFPKGDRLDLGDCSAPRCAVGRGSRPWFAATQAESGVQAALRQLRGESSQPGETTAPASKWDEDIWPLRQALDWKTQRGHSNFVMVTTIKRVMATALVQHWYSTGTALVQHWYSMVKPRSTQRAVQDPWPLAVWRGGPRDQWPAVAESGPEARSRPWMRPTQCGFPAQHAAGCPWPVGEPLPKPMPPHDQQLHAVWSPLETHEGAAGVYFNHFIFFASHCGVQWTVHRVYACGKQPTLGAALSMWSACHQEPA